MRMTVKRAETATETELAEYLGDSETDILVGLCAKFPEDTRGDAEEFLKKTLKRANERGLVWYTNAGEVAARRYLLMWRDRFIAYNAMPESVSESIQASSEVATGETVTVAEPAPVSAIDGPIPTVVESDATVA